MPKTTQFDLSNSSRNSNPKPEKKTTAIIIIFAARRNYGCRKLCRSNKSQQIIECINNQWKKISITKHLLFKSAFNLCTIFCRYVIASTPSSTPVRRPVRPSTRFPFGPFATSVNTYLLLLHNVDGILFK